MHAAYLFDQSTEQLTYVLEIHQQKLRLTQYNLIPYSVSQYSSNTSILRFLKPLFVTLQDQIATFITYLRVDMSTQVGFLSSQKRSLFFFTLNEACDCLAQTMNEVSLVKVGSSKIFSSFVIAENSNGITAQVGSVVTQLF